MENNRTDLMDKNNQYCDEMFINVRLLGDIAPLNTLTVIKNTIDFSFSNLILYNLETPLIIDCIPKNKAGPNISGNIDILRQFLDERFIANLSNNHIMDYGIDGLELTIKELSKYKLMYFGAGFNQSKSRNPLIIKTDVLSLGIIGTCEKQFGIATPWNAGVASYGPWIYSCIKRLKQNSDIIIISIHGASEMSPWPSPGWQELLRSFIDAGASIVHGHHSHIPQGFEEYNRGLIFYGLGNFLVDPNVWKERANTLWSIIPDIKLAEKGIESYQIKYSVLEANQNEVTVRESNEEEYSKFNTYISCANLPLNDERLLNSLWQEHSVRMFNGYYSKWLGINDNKEKALLNKLKSFMKSKSITNQQKLLLYHLFACESHRSSIETALGVMSGEIDDLRTEETRDLVNRMMPWSKEFAD